MNMLYVILKHVVWRFRIYNYFCEIFKFHDFMNTLRNFAKSVFAHIFTFYTCLSSYWVAEERHVFNAYTMVDLNKHHCLQGLVRNVHFIQ